jgi:hypothetical protein
MTLEAPQYQARNSATGALLVEHDEPVVGTYTWVATAILRLVSEDNRDAFKLERV